ncbi:peptidylprolyl isomerase [Aeromicrobium duanguangcaii]|uniref:peptidylprolyl isomerase n=1 Tax=Aeromicrobium duanguangcaii TaxID=2968086 RepID=UPI002017AA6E|nr:peptidylprolyl isomerase [Aeromicrobium duanguangcaii]MCL3838512.1 peptidylprolyl isomerase [Aeromicrobium duanguangcaii]
MRLRLLALLILAVPVLAACGGDDDGDSGDTAAGTCTYVKDGSASKEAKMPPAEPKAADTLTVATNRGDMKLTLTPDAAPCTVSSFVSLAEQGYFDGTKCHRLVPGFVLQCGDPSATGTGGPGYRFDDELSGDETYPAGTLAMANTGQPDTNGSQFFIVLADADLPPQYTVFGKVDAAGLKVAQAIEKDGNGPDGVAPAKDVVIESVS